MNSLSYLNQNLIFDVHIKDLFEYPEFSNKVIPRFDYTRSQFNKLIQMLRPNQERVERLKLTPLNFGFVIDIWKSEKDLEIFRSVYGQTNLESLKTFFRNFNLEIGMYNGHLKFTEIDELNRHAQKFYAELKKKEEEHQTLIHIARLYFKEGMDFHSIRRHANISRQRLKRILWKLKYTQRPLREVLLNPSHSNDIFIYENLQDMVDLFDIDCQSDVSLKTKYEQLISRNPEFKRISFNQYYRS